MAALLTLLIAIALVDALSMVPIALVPLATMLAGAQGYARVLGFIAGIGLSYYAAGLVAFLGLSRLFETLDAYLRRVWFEPARLELALQIATGALLLFLAWKLVRARTADERAGAPERSGIAAAFVFGVAITLVGLPGALPYLGAIDQILRADVGLARAASMLVVYNLAFVAPLLLLVGTAALFPLQSGRLLAVVARVMARWGTRAVVLVLTLFGAAMVIDGIGWFLGHPLIPVGTPPPGLAQATSLSRTSG